MTTVQRNPHYQPALGASGGVPANRTPEEAADACQVLVVEDDPAHRLLAEDVLEEAGYAVTTADNGLQALRAVAQDTPDVIVLDAHMPVMDGVAFACSYHAQPLPHAPIVLVSADYGINALAAQVEPAAVLQKPFAAGALVATVERALTPPVPAPGSP